MCKNLPGYIYLSLFGEYKPDHLANTGNTSFPNNPPYVAKKLTASAQELLCEDYIFHFDHVFIV